MRCKIIIPFGNVTACSWNKYYRGYLKQNAIDFLSSCVNNVDRAFHIRAEDKVFLRISLVFVHIFQFLFSTVAAKPKVKVLE